tara:strand:+ start:766 stop:1602 length:837 start_codon:yes stop_codon:yes gene_type:complete
MKNLNVFTEKKELIANAHLTDNSEYIISENLILTNCKISRNIFRNLVISQLIIYKWDSISFELNDYKYKILRYSKTLLPNKELISAYKRIWINSDIYKKKFTSKEINQILIKLQFGLIIIDSNSQIVGIIAGWPLNLTPDSNLYKIVKSVDLSFYIAEWGLVESNDNSIYRGKGIGTFILKLFLRLMINYEYHEFVLSTAENSYTNNKINPVRKIYENYGFSLAKDSKGKILQRKIKQKRVNNEVFSHSSLFYLATSSTISNSINKENDLNSKYVFSF